MVREAITNAVPPPRKAMPRERPKLGPAAAFIDEVLQADREAPRKQRHTAHRIWVRLRQEMSAVGLAESTVREYVRKRKRELGLTGERRSSRRAIGGGRRPRWTGMKGGRSWAASSRSCTRSARGRWPAGARFTGRTRMPASRLSFARVGVSPLWWRFCVAAVRQSEKCRVARASAGGDATVHCLSVALRVPE
jgi:hypothetical protein